VKADGSSLRLERPRDVSGFEDLAGPFLRAREAENNLILGICSGLRAGEYTIEPYLAVARAGSEVVGAALRTPPYRLVLSNPIDERAVSLLVEDLRASSPGLTGVLGEVAASRRFAKLWTERTGRPHRLNMAERIFRLERVIPPRLVPGTMRVASAGDRALLGEWIRAFVLEALGPGEDASHADEQAGRWIERRSRTMYLWEADGRTVSMCGVSGETASGIRVAPVYTPSELRGRGYASALTAAVSQAQLDRGRRFCFLFTDLANPTSNRIYQRIGYEPVCDMADHRFDPADPDR